MTRLQQLERDALSLTDSERATLAARLLETLPGVLADPDGGVAEALRRESEFEKDPKDGVTLAELRKNLGR